MAFLGRSNVGKSSLLNALAGVRGLARVSGTPGRTRLVNFFRVDDLLYLADLPGYGYAKVAESERRSWERLVTSYLVERKPLALCVFLVDVRHEPGQGDLMLRDFLDHHALPHVLVATKSDKLGSGELEKRRRALAGGAFSGARAVILASAETRAGIDELWRQIRQAAAERREGVA